LANKNLLNVKEAAALLGYKNDETIKRKIKASEFPNAFRNSRKEGWKIPVSDLKIHLSTSQNDIPSQSLDQVEVIKLAYRIANLSSPTEEVLRLLTEVGFKRAIEICFVMRQQSKGVDEPYKFIRAAITKGYKPDPLGNQKKIYEYTQREFEAGKVPFYNWLEE
jgi:hypothetical protein